MAGWLSRWIAFEKYASFESDDHTVQANGMRAPSLLKDMRYRELTGRR